MGSTGGQLHHFPVLVVGAGPVGLLTALVLAHHDIPCMLIERNLHTTRWPKMDVTNVRSMELLRNLGLADEFRKQGVPQHYSFDVLFSTGMGKGGENLATWDLPSPDWWRQKIKETNDGSMPREPYQRCSQVIFEAWLKPICEANPLISTFFGYKFEKLSEAEDEVESTLTALETNEEIIVRSKYVIACDGAGSRVRRSTGLKITGGPVPISMYLVHFRSRDLQRLHSQGQFWHIFSTAGGAIISQDEDEIWTVHVPMSLDTDTDNIDPAELVYEFLGGHTGRYPIKIDEILVKSVWRPNLVVADKYRTEGGRVFLCGDSAHQNIPTGGYGMNMGVGDAYDIGWKLAAVLKGYGGRFLLDSYEHERRPVALRNVDRSGDHQKVHWEYCNWVKESGSETLLSDTNEARQLKQKIANYVMKVDGENKDHGIEMGYRHKGSPVILNREGEQEPPWSVRHYIPSTWPGSRSPHVFLRDGHTSIFDLFGPGYSIVDFTSTGTSSARFCTLAKRLGIPIKRVWLSDEEYVRDIWGRDVVLIRPDGHVAWRCDADRAEVSPEDAEIETILRVSVGQQAAPDYYKAHSHHKLEKATMRTLKAFAATGGNVEQDAGKIEKMAAFQT